MNPITLSELPEIKPAQIISKLIIFDPRECNVIRLKETEFKWKILTFVSWLRAQGKYIHPDLIY